MELFCCWYIWCVKISTSQPFFRRSKFWNQISDVLCIRYEWLLQHELSNKMQQAGVKIYTFNIVARKKHNIIFRFLFYSVKQSSGLITSNMYCTLTEVFITLTEVFPCFFLSCKANARMKLAKTGHGPHSSTLFVICVVRLIFVLFYILFVCKCVLPPGDNPIAVNKYIVSYSRNTLDSVSFNLIEC
jgi:hypothetical protein